MSIAMAELCQTGMHAAIPQIHGMAGIHGPLATLMGQGAGQLICRATKK